METQYGHLSYCSNIHAGESWEQHFKQLQEHVPAVKKKVSPSGKFGMGLRLSNQASIELSEGDHLKDFIQWLRNNDCYVFTMNGFPYGGFHHTIVKDKVHAPDWTTKERVGYTVRLAKILSTLLPENMEGGISTSPLTYRFWHTDEQLPDIFEKATMHVLEVVDQLIQIKQATGKFIHLDIEPEPDGLLGEGGEFIAWYTGYLLPLGVHYIAQLFGCDAATAKQHILQHVQLCYDVCHFAICFEDHVAMRKHLDRLGIRTGKIQISAALKAELPEDLTLRKTVTDAFSRFNEPTYLHQVVALQTNGLLKKYADMPEALEDAGNPSVREWRAHFHVPIFVEGYGLLQSTQQDIEYVLSMHKQRPFTSHLEIETYTWEVLPVEQKLPLTESIIREIQWVQKVLKDPA